MLLRKKGQSAWFSWAICFITDQEMICQKNPPLCEGDILIHGHTHVLKAEQMEGYILLNPGSVSIPKEGNPPTYAMLEDGVFSIMDFDGNIVKSIVL